MARISTVAERIIRIVGCSRRSVCLAFLAGLLLAHPATAQQETERPQGGFVFCYQDTELFPNYMGAGTAVPETRPGVNIELVDLVGEQVDVPVHYVRYSWNRCLALMTAGRVDSVIASYTDDRAEIAVYPMAGTVPDAERRLTTSGYYLYHRKDSQQWDGERFADPDITIAAPLGYSIVRDLNRLNMAVVEASTTEGLLNLLIYSRIDAVAAPGSTADAIRRNDVTKYASIVKDPAPLRQSPYFIVFSKQFAETNPALVERVWAAVPNVRRTYRASLLEAY